MWQISEAILETPKGPFKEKYKWVGLGSLQFSLV